MQKPQGDRLTEPETCNASATREGSHVKKEDGMKQQQGIERDIRLLVRHLDILARTAVREERRNQEQKRAWSRLSRDGLLVGVLILGAVLDRILLLF